MNFAAVLLIATLFRVDQNYFHETEKDQLSRCENFLCEDSLPNRSFPRTVRYVLSNADGFYEAFFPERAHSTISQSDRNGNVIYHHFVCLYVV